MNRRIYNTPRSPWIDTRLYRLPSVIVLGTQYCIVFIDRLIRQTKRPYDMVHQHDSLNAILIETFQSPYKRRFLQISESDTTMLSLGSN